MTPLLKECSRPAILVGGGARGARLEIESYAIAHDIPCFRTWNALDVITDDSPVYCGTIGTYGGPGRNFGIQNCDLLIALGCRMSGRITGGLPHTFARGAHKVIVDVDPHLLDPALQQVKGDENVLMDCGKFLEEARSLGTRFPEWLRTCRDWCARYDPVKPEHFKGLHHYGFVRLLSGLLSENAIVTYDTGGNAIMMGHCFRSKFGQRIFSSNGNTPMGGALCYGIGAAIAEPGRPVYVLIGDGGMQLNIQEMQTLQHYRPDVRVIILNNKVLANTLLFQVQNGMQTIACISEHGYSSPDFVAVARAYGIVANRWDAPTANLNETVLGMRGPWVMDVVHENFCDFAPRMTLWDAGIEECYPVLPEDEFLSNMLIEPLPGWRERRGKYKHVPDAYR